MDIYLRGQQNRRGADGTIDPAYFASLLGAPAGTSDTELKAYIKAIVGDDIPSSALNSTSAFESWLTDKGWTLKDLSAMIISGSATITSPLTATRTVGGVTSGKHYETGTTIEQIIRDILNPVDAPTLTAPSATINYTGNRLLEAGVTITGTFVVNFSRGTINPAYGTSGYRSGIVTGYSLNDSTFQTGKIFSNVTINKDNSTFIAKVKYEAGEQPKDSSGNDYGTPLPAGQVTSSSLKFEFVDAWWMINSSGEMTKQELKSKASGEALIQFPDRKPDEGVQETLDIPASWNITDILFYNPITREWVDDSDEFVTSTASHPDAAGNMVDYVRYTGILPYAGASREFKIKWTT